MKKIGISWSCFAGVDTVSPDILRLMKEAGCHQICYGFESADDDILKAINKKIDSDKSFRAVLWTKEAGIDARGGLYASAIQARQRKAYKRRWSIQKNKGYSLPLITLPRRFPAQPCMIRL